MIKIQLMSDLHIDSSTHPYNWKFSKTDADVVVIAGDVTDGPMGAKWAAELATQLQTHIVMVLGNHDYLYCDLDVITYARKITSKHSKYFHLLEKDIFEYKGYSFLGTTLWTDFLLYGEAGKFVAMKSASDAMVEHVYVDAGRFKAKEALAEHEKSIMWLKQNLNGLRDIVVTHHAPSAYMTNPKFRNDMCTPAYASDLEGFILERQPLAWFCGHSHHAKKMYVGKTLLQSNPKGYTNESLNFNPHLIIEL